eukprot:gnl/Trimastix_PCT/2442.p1 GENE.gnl/Trimastix_PCT/2442~~gnl/Trimastix_PCT/2442.p1  ORF type:complete len:325 (-),score=39.12 gnl/Trimastix_PCT/2442:46-900(-)
MARNEGWNPGNHDSLAFYHADPGSFLIAIYEGQKVASISAVRFGMNQETQECKYGFIGFFIVTPELRNQGIGEQIWDAGMNRLLRAKCPCIALDGVLAQVHRYERTGFRLAHRNARHEGKTPLVPREEMNLSELSGTIVPGSQIDTEQLIGYDRRFFPAERTAFLTQWFTLPQSESQVIRGEETGEIVGLGVLRQCGVGYKVGPLYARDINQAARLLLSLTASLPAQTPVYLDTPGCNPSAAHLASDLFSMKVVFETARMYTSEQPPEDVCEAEWFGVTTFELG